MPISASRHLLLFALFALSIGHGIGQTKARWYKGNLHTHSYWSDGDEFPEVILDWYRSHGYDFVCLSDHNTIAGGEKWITVARSKMYEDSFNSYLSKFGNNWVTYKVDSGRTQVKLKTFSEYSARFTSDRFLVIKAEEITDKFEKKPIHMNAINLRSLIPPQGGASVSEVIQRNIDAVLKQREETGEIMFPHLNHPNFYWAITAADMIKLKGERFFEVYNGHPLVNNDGDSIHSSTEKMWDEINIAYLKRGQPPMFAIATDDSHNYHQFGKAYSNAGRGWVMVNCDSLSPSSLLGAMEAGKFYASTGVVLKGMQLRKSTVSVEVEGEEGISYSIQFIGVRKGSNASEVLKSVSGQRASFEINNNLIYVRIKVISSKLKATPFHDLDYETAWTQPIVK